MRSHCFIMCCLAVLVGVTSVQAQSFQTTPGDPAINPPMSMPRIGYSNSGEQQMDVIAGAMQAASKTTAYHQALQNRTYSQNKQRPALAQSVGQGIANPTILPPQSADENSMTVEQQYQMLRRSNLAKSAQRDAEYAARLQGRPQAMQSYQRNDRPVRYAMNQAFSRDPFGEARQDPFADPPGTNRRVPANMVSSQPVIQDPFGLPPNQQGQTRQRDPFGEPRQDPFENPGQQQPQDVPAQQGRQQPQLPDNTPLPEINPDVQNKLPIPQNNQPLPMNVLPNPQDRVPPRIPGGQTIPQDPRAQQLPTPRPYQVPQQNQLPEIVQPPAQRTPRAPIMRRIDPRMLPMIPRQGVNQNPSPQGDLPGLEGRPQINPNRQMEEIHPSGKSEYQNQPPIISPDQYRQGVSEVFAIPRSDEMELQSKNALYDNGEYNAPVKAGCNTCDQIQSGWSDPQFYLSIFGGFTDTDPLRRDYDSAIMNVESGGGLGFAVGQMQGRNLRTELEYSTRWNDITSFNGNSVTGSLQTNAGMANGYWEFSQFPHPCFKPYVGAGLGYMFADPDMRNSAGVLLNDGSSSFAWQFMTGVNYKASEKLDWFVEYRRTVADELDLHQKGQMHQAGGAMGLYNYETDNFFFGARFKF